MAGNVWKSLCQHVPTPTVVVDKDKRILLMSNKAEELLNIEHGAMIGEDADVVLCLSTVHHKWVPTQDKLIDTRIEGARVIFQVSHVSGSVEAAGATFLTIISLSRSNVILYSSVQSSDSSAEDDVEWRTLQYQMLDEVPATIVAVSADGKHVYQNAQAHATLGPIATPSNGVAEWIKQQYKGAKHPDGTNFDHTQLPIFHAAINKRATDPVEIYFGRFVYMISGRPLYDRRGNHCGGMVFSNDVTEIRQQAERKEQLALQQSDICFREVTNTMEQIVWVARGGKVDYYNRRWYEFTGASEEDSLGEAWYQFLHPDDVDNTRNNWLLTANEEDRFITQHRLRALDGSYRWFLARAISVRDEKGRIINWLGTSTDITQITEALEDAKRAKEQLFNIMQIAHVDYFVVTRDYIMTSVFLAGTVTRKGLYDRYDSHALLNHDVRFVLSATLLRKLEAVFDGRITSATDETELDGVWWRTQVKAIREVSTNRILGAVGTAVDITEDKLKDEQLAKASTERLVAIQNSRFKGEFLARMSHEIRTPIGGILGMVQLMKDAFHPEDNQQVFFSPAKESESSEYLESIKRCGDALLVIINDILDFSKIEVGKMDIESNPFDLNLMVKDVFMAAQHGAHKQNDVQLGLEYSVPPGIVFKGDCNRIRQVLMNLMSNAMKFTEHGSVVCRVCLCDEDARDIDATIPGATLHRVKFQVRDTGIGIPRPALEKLFNPFVQADSSTARKFGGTGLGLSIARQLVRLMSGALNLESIPSPEIGHGSVATCIIPLEISDRAALHSMLPPPLHKFTGLPKVLLVEDNRINQVIAKKTLEKLGLQIVIAENGQEAVDYLYQADSVNMPDIVLMDCQMPLLDGYQATSQIRRLRNTVARTLPIVAMTASAISGDREKCLAAGMNDYVSKPINPQILSQTIRKYLEPEPADQLNTNLLHQSMKKAILPVYDSPGESSSSSPGTPSRERDSAFATIHHAPSPTPERTSKKPNLFRLSSTALRSDNT